MSNQEANDPMQELSDVEPLGLEVAYAYLAMAEAAFDGVEREVLYNCSLFHKGDISAQEAIEPLIQKHGVARLKPIYDKHNL